MTSKTTLHTERGFKQPAMAKQITGFYSASGYKVFVTYTNGCSDDIPLEVGGNNRDIDAEDQFISYDDPNALSLEEIKSDCQEAVVYWSQEEGIPNYEVVLDTKQQQEIEDNVSTLKASQKASQTV